MLPAASSAAAEASRPKRMSLSGQSRPRARRHRGCPAGRRAADRAARRPVGPSRVAARPRMQAGISPARGAVANDLNMRELFDGHRGSREARPGYPTRGRSARGRAAETAASPPNAERSHPISVVTKSTFNKRPRRRGPRPADARDDLCNHGLMQEWVQFHTMQERSFCFYLGVGFFLAERCILDSLTKAI